MKRTPLILSSFAVAAVMAIGGMTLLPSAQAGKSDAQTVVLAEQTATFAVEKMTCAACPIIVRKAMEAVDGVKSVSVDFDAKTVTVVFDNAVTSAQQISEASTNAGYPASIVVSEAG